MLWLIEDIFRAAGKKNDPRTCNNIQNIATRPEDYCLLDSGY